MKEAKNKKNLSYNRKYILYYFLIVLFTELYRNFYKLFYVKIREREKRELLKAFFKINNLL